MADEFEDDEAEAEYELWTQRWSAKQKGAPVVGTASYAHTLMRVRTMDEPALGRRIAAIERAKGQHAVVKMRLFARVLCLVVVVIAVVAVDRRRRRGRGRRRGRARAGAPGEEGGMVRGLQRRRSTNIPRFFTSLHIKNFRDVLRI